LEDILMACLRKDPNERPQTMHEIAQSLRAVKLESPWTEERARRWLEHSTAASRPGRPKPATEPVSSAASVEAPLAADLR
jgi:hypothetical protein